MLRYWSESGTAHFGIDWFDLGVAPWIMIFAVGIGYLQKSVKQRRLHDDPHELELSVIGGLPDATAQGIGVSILDSLELAANTIMLLVILAGVLWLAGRRARRPWSRVLHIGSAILGFLALTAAIALGLLVGGI